MEKVRLRILGTLAVATALALSATPAMAAGSNTQSHHGHAERERAPYTCTGGDIPSGNYASITVTGFCAVPANAVIRVRGNVNVRAGAVLDAQSAPSTITVGDNVTAAAGALVGLGCQPDYVDSNGNHIKTGHPCSDPHGSESSTITVNENVTATGADTVLLNGITVKRNVTLTGGGGAIPWSIKNNTIGGNLKVSEVTADWVGVLFNSIGKNATLTNITVTDPGDPGRLVFVVRNTIGRNLSCMGLAPGVSGGFFPGEVNVVGRHAIGQCASLI
jgi:hypothetical protein